MRRITITHDATTSRKNRLIEARKDFTMCLNSRIVDFLNRRSGVRIPPGAPYRGALRSKVRILARDADFCAPWLLPFRRGLRSPSEARLGAGAARGNGRRGAPRTEIPLRRTRSMGGRGKMRLFHPRNSHLSAPWPSSTKEAEAPLGFGRDKEYEKRRGEGNDEVEGGNMSSMDSEKTPRSLALRS